MWPWKLTILINDIITSNEVYIVTMLLREWAVHNGVTCEQGVQHLERAWKQSVTNVSQIQIQSPEVTQRCQSQCWISDNLLVTVAQNPYGRAWGK